MSKKKIAIIFFGLTRSLQETLPFLKKNLFDEITACGLEYDIYLHTYILNGTYRNQWSGENISRYNNNVYKLLNAKYLLLDNQQEIEKKINFNEYCSLTKNWCGSNVSTPLAKYLVHNMVLALYSKKCITNLFKEHHSEYDFAIIMRPDLKLHKKINISEFMKITTDDNIIMPQQDVHWNGNDRFCFATNKNIIYYGTLLDPLLNYSKNNEIAAEKYLYDMLIAKKLNIIYRADIVYDTVRASSQNQQEPRNIKVSIDFNKNQVFYGCDKKWCDITEKCKELLKIPAGNNNKDLIFGDPCFMIPKKIMIKNIETSIQNIYEDDCNISFE